MKKEKSIGNILYMVFWIGIIVIIVVYISKPSSTNVEDVSTSITTEELQE